LPHEPQWFGSLERSAQSTPQVTSPVPLHAHTPALHVCPLPHVCKHAPQFCASFWRFVQSGPHVVIGAMQFIAGPVSGPASGRGIKPVSCGTTLPSPPPVSEPPFAGLDEQPPIAASVAAVHNPSARDRLPSDMGKLLRGVKPHYPRRMTVRAESGKVSARPPVRTTAASAADVRSGCGVEGRFS
jgi:hypothetical protein